MENNLTILNLERTISSGVVFKVDYQFSVASGSWSTREIGNLEVSGSVSDPGFVPYDSLTEDIVKAWVTSSVDDTPIYAELSSSIAIAAYSASLITTSEGKPWDN